VPVAHGQRLGLAVLVRPCGWVVLVVRGQVRIIPGGQVQGGAQDVAAPAQNGGLAQPPVLLLRRLEPE